MPTASSLAGAVKQANDAVPVLAVRHISKRFGGTQALRDVGLELEAGSVLALLGENGAGKSTLIKILAGVHMPDEGDILYRGSPTTASQVPIAFIHQDLGLIEWMTVAENICLALGYPRRWGVIHFGDMRARARHALDEIGVAIDPDTRIEDLSRTEKALVAVSRALASDAEIVVMDEPTASLPANEVERLFAGIRRLRSRGVAVIYVSHRLDEVFEIADRMVVLRDGRVAGRSLVGAITPQDVVIQIVGREPSQVFRRASSEIGSPRMRLSEVELDGVGPLTCDFNRGEVVGLVGLRGAGHERIGQALFGLVPIASGTVTLDGVPIAPTSPREAMNAGIELIWGDRNNGSVVPGLTVKENLFLNQTVAGLGTFSYVSPRGEDRQAADLGRKVGLRPNNPHLPIEALSGGNQQKVIVGRWLSLKGKVYIFEDPTAGVDVGAKADIYQLFNVALAAGAAIVIVSTDFEEVANVCHRALVFDRGRVVAEIAGEELTARSLLAAASAGEFSPSPKG
ncbi:sugar ABC transporter ATP-binding protein [Labrys monachus]|uniref:Ribose transport system ATP-binding protein n=1 Tax=Labrys monachus TaxID=217067 RepID=A0ABU0FDQ1_9HYPH|nr:sugar ABC transporter ATP-binding protein [Labrys monachus]MDQ0392738.1 ribose transport system ATP-binding protein [Labrys monachus]